MLLVVAAVAVVAVLGWVAFTLGSDGDLDRDTTADPTKSPSHSRTSSPDPDPEPAPEVTAAGMETFVEDYLAMVTSDPKEAWENLTPAFQDASGNFGTYQGFWKTIDSAQVVSVTADPDSRQVTYTVEYVRADGSTTTDQVTLQLEGTDGEYLISAET